MLSNIITVCYFLLFLLTPLLWSPQNYELFEYNKMMFVYALTTIIVTCFIAKMIREGKFLIKRTPLDIPILLFLGANILSTIFSIDPHMSWWGYYSRSNGGLYSTISYIILYYCLVSLFDTKRILTFLKVSLFTGLVISLWAITEHFGVSPSCYILNSTFTDSCWVQDVQARVFATLGQPNWLAAYLCMLIFPALYFLLKSKTILFKSYYLFLIFCYFIAFTFTYSRAGTLGLVGGILTLAIALFIKKKKPITELYTWKIFSIIAVVFLAVILLFGTPFTNFRILALFAAPVRPPITISKPTDQTQLETGGSQSGQIRLIVWKGAIEIFKHYPIFGSGVETFADSYYNYRPIEHNLVTEWDFLYNKAHNEFLNYLSTTGAVGFTTYILMILSFTIWTIKKVVSGKSKNPLFLSLMLASLVSYHIQDFFGFSVVIISLYFFLFPGFVFLIEEDIKPTKLSLNFFPFSSIYHFVYSRKFYPSLLSLVIFIIGATLLGTIIRFYIGDIFFAIGYHYNQAGATTRAYNALYIATTLNPGEPFYRSELGYAAAGSAVALSDSDATRSAELVYEAVNDTNVTLSQNPRNLNYWRTAVRTYYLLSTLNKGYSSLVIKSLDEAIALAPTDPKLVYNKGVVLDEEGKTYQAIQAVRKAVQLKPNYKEAILALADLYFKSGQKDKAIAEAEKVFVFIPNDPDALTKIKLYKSSKK